MIPCFLSPCFHQDAVEIPEMMEEEKPLADSDAGAPPANVHPTMSMPSLSPPTQGQEAAVHDNTVNTESGSQSSEPPPFSADQAEPMDVEDHARQPQLGNHPQFWSGE
jgi:hypothetical protein